MTPPLTPDERVRARSGTPGADTSAVSQLVTRLAEFTLVQTTRPNEATPAPAGRDTRAPRPTKIYPYDPPRPLASNLWQVKGSLPSGPIPRNMTVYRLPDGRLLLYSVIAMHEEFA